jgi:hypothetical protein
MLRAGLVIVLLAASGAVVHAQTEPERDGDDRAIQQLLVDYILAEKPAWHGYTAETFCVALGQLEWKNGVLVPPTGPSELFLSRIANRGFVVLPARSCKMVSMGIDKPGVLVVATGGPAFFITVSEIVHRTSSGAEAQAGFVCGAMCAWGVTFVLEKHDGKWAIASRKDVVISRNERACGRTRG